MIKHSEIKVKPRVETLHCFMKRPRKIREKPREREKERQRERGIERETEERERDRERVHK